MPYEILLTEWLGSGGAEMVYVKPPDSSRVSRLDPSLRRGGLAARAWGAAGRVLLPRGYPDSVSQDYAAYQVWDTLQAFCSTLGHILTTQAILVGVGVGDNEASALGAALTWILKDGAGMISGIVFAWWSGSSFDADCRKWRLLADVLNDTAMILNLCLLPLLPGYSLEILCFTSSLRALVGVAGGATRAAVTHHQAISDNMGDVSAKDSSQETCVNLVASLLGVIIISSLSQSNLVYPLFALIVFLHLYFNYRAVRALKFRVFNPERFHLVLYHYLIGGFIPSPEAIADMESVNVLSGFSDLKLSGYRVKLGSSLQGLNLTSNQLRMISSLYKERNFMLVQSTICVRAVLSRSANVKDVLQAYFHGLMLALASSCSCKQVPSCFSEESPPEDSFLKRFISVLKLHSPRAADLLNIEELIEVDQACSQEFAQFWNGLAPAGWDLSSHQLHGIDAGWRASWRPESLKPHSL